MNQVPPGYDQDATIRTRSGQRPPPIGNSSNFVLALQLRDAKYILSYCCSLRPPAALLLCADNQERATAALQKVLFGA